MIVDFEIPIGLKIDDFKPILDKYPSFKSANREIKLNSILGNSKIELEISDIRPAKLGYFTNISEYPSLKDSSFKVNKIFLGIENENAIYMKCDINTLENEMGLILKELISNKANLKFKISLSGTISDFQVSDKFFVTY
jgi:hypothetical protein